MSSWYLNPIFEQQLGGLSTLLILMLVAGLLVTWFVGWQWTAASLQRRSILSALRIVTIILVLLAMLRPTHVHVEKKQLPSTVVVLLDKSRSMLIEDTLSGKSRWAVLRKILTDLAPDLGSLGDNVELKVYAFDSDVTALQHKDGLIELPENPDGNHTDHGTAMRGVMRREDGKRLIGFILAGDGAQQTLEGNTAPAQAAARELGRIQCPLVAISFGQHRSRRQAKDVILESMPDNLTVFAKNEVNISGTIRVSGYVDQAIPVQLIVELEPGNSEILATTTIRATADNQQLPYELTYIPEEAGEYAIAVRAVPQSGELTTSNNEIPTYLSVREGGIRVLYVQGEVRPEQRYLRRALAPSPNIDVDLRTVFSHSEARDNWPVKGFDELFKPDAYDVYILGDVDSAAFSKNDLTSLRNAVNNGAGLIMLGGWHSFWPGGYHRTPLADVLPLAIDAELDDRTRQRFEEFIPPDLHIEGPIQMLPARPWGESSFVMQLAPVGENMAAWKSLPRLSGANRFRGVSPNGFTLAETAAGEPLLVSSEPNGRVLAFAVDSTWQWAMHGHVEEHRRFWRQVILWLAKHDQITEGSVQVQLDGRRFAPGAPVTFTTTARSPHGETLEDAQWTAKVVLPDGSEQPLRLAHRGTEMFGQFLQTEPLGQYVVHVTASHDGEEIGTARSQFLVYKKDFELGGITADPAFLASLADKTREVGGRMIVPEELSEFLRDLAATADTYETEVTENVTYWDRPWFFILLVLFLSVEWYLRKRWRLA